MGLGKVIAGFAAAAVVAEGAYCVAKGPSSLLRPPGSQGESDFMARCVKCGKCVEACPYAAIQVAGIDQGSAAGTPALLDVRERPCHLCPDFPCVNACPTDALRDVAEKHDANMGYAVIDEDICIAFKGYRCEVCYRVCPLIDEAITVENQAIEGDDRHSKFLPRINKDVCTGCGLCVQRCAVSDPRVPIKIVSIAEAEKKKK